MRAAAVVPFTELATELNISRSQSGAGTYVPEYVAFNNSSTLNKLPFFGTAINGCRWVTIENLTAPSAPKSPFHNVQYVNVTAANASGAIDAHQWQTSFRLCAGSAAWINYAYWTYGVYDFTTTGLVPSATATVTFGAYPGTTAVPSTLTPSLSTVSLTIASNLSFSISFPSPVNSATTCDATGQICHYQAYSFVSASLTGTSTVNTTGTITYGKLGTVTGYALVSAAYANWTAGYTNATVQANTAIGGFFSAGGSFFNQWIMQFWYLWFLVILVLVIVALAARGGRRGRR
ncbi:MAG: hypothetical protein ACYDFT_00305 [Thermoplasmata archaeon]